jgi:hypothetical protein
VLAASVPHLDEGPGTGLIQVFVNDPHPELGSGAVIVLRLPVTFDEDEAAHLATELNRLEAEGESNTPMMGAWCQDPNDANSVTFVSFVPSIIAWSGVLENLVTYNSIRAGWAHDILN